MIESRNGKKEKQIILRLMLHLLDCQKERKNFASSGNRTRAARVAGEHSTTEPTMPGQKKKCPQSVGFEPTLPEGN